MKKSAYFVTMFLLLLLLPVIRLVVTAGLRPGFQFYTRASCTSTGTSSTITSTSSSSSTYFYHGYTTSSSTSIIYFFLFWFFQWYLKFMYDSPALFSSALGTPSRAYWCNPTFTTNAWKNIIIIIIFFKS